MRTALLVWFILGCISALRLVRHLCTKTYPRTETTSAPIDALTLAVVTGIQVWLGMLLWSAP